MYANNTLNKFLRAYTHTHTLTSDTNISERKLTIRSTLYKTTFTLCLCAFLSLPFSRFFIVWFFGRYISFIRFSIFVARNRTSTHSVRFFILLCPDFMLWCYLRFATYSISILKKMNFLTNCSAICMVGVDPFQCVYLFRIAVFFRLFIHSFSLFNLLKSATLVAGTYPHTSAMCIGMNMKDTTMETMNSVHQVPNTIENVCHHIHTLIRWKLNIKSFTRSM